MRIILFLNDPYPFGYGNTDRMHLYAKGLIELGNDVLVLIPRPTELNGKVKNIDITGIFENVQYKYTYKTTIRSNGFIIRRFHDFVSYWNSMFILFIFQPSHIICSGTTLVHFIGIKLFALIKGAKVTRERSEAPFYQHESLSLIQRIRVKLVYGLYDGIIVINENTKKNFQDVLFIKTNIIEIPILIEEPQLKELIINKNINSTSLVYTGSLLNHKDGIFTIIESFAKLSIDYPEVRLIMTGDLDTSPDKVKIQKLIEKLNIVEKIHFLGYVSKDELRQIMHSATALLLAKPSNRQNRNNMATKIGEYLLTSRPVILSSVDSACKYLVHRKNVLISDPTIDSFTKEIKFVLDNPDIGTHIGKMGYKAAIEIFNYKKHVSRINEFLLHL